MIYCKFYNCKVALQEISNATFHTFLPMYYKLDNHTFFSSVKSFCTSVCKCLARKNELSEVYSNEVAFSVRAFIFKPQLYKLGILKITDLYKFKIAKIMHQYIRHVLPLAPNFLFSNVCNVHHLPTRSKSQQKLYIHSKSFSKSLPTIYKISKDKNMKL